MKGVTRALALLGAVWTATSVAIADNKLVQDITSDPGSFSALFMHDSITVDHDHLVDHNGDWKVWGGFFCFAGFLTSDAMGFGVSNQHVHPPHQEGPSEIATVAAFVLAKDYSDYTYLYLEGDVTCRSHEQHFDVRYNRGVVKLATLLGITDIASYNWWYVGYHTDNPNLHVSIDLESLKDNVVPPSDDESYGTCSLTLDPQTGIVAGTAGINGMQLGNLLHAGLYMGGPGQVGQQILDLGGSNNWVAMDTVGIATRVQGVIPQQFVPLLLNGQVYFQAETFQFPNGAIRGQSVVPPYGVQPDQFQPARGRVVSGDVSNAVNSDDSYIVMTPHLVLNQIEDPIQSEFMGSALLRQPQSMSLMVEGRADTPNVRQSLFVRNVQNGQWDMLDQRPIPQVDTLTQVNIPNPSLYVRQDGSVEARATFKPIGPVPNRNWKVFLDRVRWRQVR